MRDRLVAEDLARLEHHLALFVGVVVAVGEVAGAAEHVERDRVRVDLRRRQRLARAATRVRLRPRAPRPPSRRCRRPTGRWRRSGGRCPAASWIGFSATISCIVEQFGLAIRPLWPSSASGLTSETTSGISGSRRHARGVVDDDRAGLDEARRPLAATSSPPALNSARSKPWIVSSVSARHGHAVELAARGALGGERDDLARREAALAQLGAHDGADGAGGAHDGDSVAHSCRALRTGCSASTWSAPSSNASCSARTARSTDVGR